MADNSLTPDPLATLSPAGALVTTSAPEASAGDGHPLPLGAPEPTLAPPEEPEDATVEELQLALAAVVPDEPPPPMGFIISISEGGRMRRLHFAGGCFRVPGEHYKRWEDLGQATPAPHAYTARCRRCFPPDARAAEEEKAVDSDDSCSASSSSSGDSAAGLAAEAADS